MLVRIALLLLTCWCTAGCSGSRWAKSDLDYAAKYPRHTDDLARTTKQAIDARHVYGKRGAYAGAIARNQPASAGAQVGVFAYPQSYLETYGGLAGLLQEGSDTAISGGVEVGARLQTPTRLAPFVGVNGYLGYWPFGDGKDGRDNNGNGFVDEDAEDDGGEVVFAAKPEAGLHFWLTPRLRLTGSAGYQFVAEGSEPDSLTYGISLSLLETNQSCPVEASSSAQEPWEFVMPQLPEPVPVSQPSFDMPEGLPRVE
ncbi:hypothetical protein [Adhaeretor mobilis]|uniref:Lipoprotein n=1 Tax=Adhaeretor mobilis TaxID=1930276 RepID=A0A517N2F6_9BACT|nr:hypothetical protein [Adhaeretor mobilis]QDT01317.1 hypothetical protein HG15A2_46590 [Adhaeretor mobilis]